MAQPIPSDAVVVGNNIFHEQPEAKRLVDGVWKRTRTWIGSDALVDDKVDDVVALSPAPEEVSVQRGFPAVIEAQFGDDGAGAESGTDIAERTAVWELIGQDLEKPIELHPMFNTSGSSTSAIEQMNEAIRKGTARGTNWDTVFGNGSNAQKFVNYKLRGIDSFISFTYIIRKTIVFSSAVALRAEFSTSQVNTIPGKVCTYAQINVPARAKFEQPRVHTASTSNPTTWTDPTLDQWLIKAPSVKWQKGKQLWEFTREYWGAEKWADLYELGTYVP